MILRLTACGEELCRIDLGEQQTYGYFDQGDLAGTGGNLYLLLDGQEIGSLFFFGEKDGRISVTLGVLDESGEGEWAERNPLMTIEDDVRASLVAAHVAQTNHGEES